MAGNGIGIGIGFRQGTLLNSFKIEALQWQASGSIKIAGVSESVWNSNTYGGANLTIISPQYACRQSGLITKIKIRTQAVTGAFTFKLFRWNSSDSKYEVVAGSERAFTPVSNQVQTITFETPVTCALGDITGMYIPATSAIWYHVNSSPILLDRRATGNITTSDAFGTTTAYTIQCEVIGFKPYVCFVGDSILSGLNGGQSNWWMTRQAEPLPPHVKTFPGGNPLYEPAQKIKYLLSGGYLNYQNLGQTGNRWSNALATLIPDAIAVLPKRIILAFGTNDINDNVALETALASMTSIKTLIDASTITKTYVCEVLPRTGFSDANAQKVREWNAAYSTWCVANNAVLIRTHDALGQLRTSTGQLDDLKTEYNADGVHLTLAGVNKLAEIIYAAIK